MTTERQAQPKIKDPEHQQQRSLDPAEAATQSLPDAPLSPTHAPPASPNSTALQMHRANVAQMQRSLGNARVARRLAQRDDTPAASAAPAAPSAATPAASSLIVDDSAADLQPGQLQKSAFLAQLRSSVEATAAAELADSPLLAEARTQIDQQFAQYSALSGPALEQTIKREVPDAAGATSAQAYIPPICARVRTTIAEQRAALPPGTETLAGVASGIADAASSVAEGAGNLASSIGSIFFKAREGGPHAPDDPRAVQAHLGSGHALDSRVQSGLESAFGQSLAGVRVHSDARAGALSEQMNARAFTVGQDIAFGSGEYQPGTPIGDALIAHEVAHVAQQGGAPTGAVQQKGEGDYGALEADADQSAVGAVAAMWGGVKGGMAKIGQNALPQLKSGLRLQKCGGKSTPTPLTLSQTIQKQLQGSGAVDVNAMIAAIHAASVSERQTVLNDATLRGQIDSKLSPPEATLVMSALLEGSQNWKNPRGNDFYEYFVVNNGSGTLPNAATMNCWESILYAAYLSNRINAAWIKNFYNNAMTSGVNPNAVIWQTLGWSSSLPQYPATQPSAGQLLFYHTAGPIPGHVALSLGGNQAMSLWNQPGNNYFVQRISITDLAGTIYIGNPPW